MDMYLAMGQALVSSGVSAALPPWLLSPALANLFGNVSVAGYSLRDYLKAGAVVAAVIAAITLTALRWAGTGLRVI